MHTRLVVLAFLVSLFGFACDSDETTAADMAVDTGTLADGSLDMSAPDSTPDAANDASDDGAEPDGGAPDAAIDSSLPDLSSPDLALDLVPDGSAGDTWTSFGEDFFASYCVGCHSGSPRDYQTSADVMRDSATIRCGVAPIAEPASGCGPFPPPEQFPVGNGAMPSEDERRRIVAWIDAGMPE